MLSHISYSYLLHIGDVGVFRIVVWSKRWNFWAIIILGIGNFEGWKLAEQEEELSVLHQLQNISSNYAGNIKFMMTAILLICAFSTDKLTKQLPTLVATVALVATCIFEYESINERDAICWGGPVINVRDWHFWIISVEQFLPFLFFGFKPFFSSNQRYSSHGETKEYTLHGMGVNTVGGSHTSNTVDLVDNSTVLN
jgi:hypothetical protein